MKYRSYVQIIVKRFHERELLRAGHMKDIQRKMECLGRLCNMYGVSL